MSDLPLKQYRQKSQDAAIHQQERASDSIIFAVLFQLMLEQSYESINLQQISKLTGISRTTLYRRWVSIDALTLDAIANKIQGSIRFETFNQPELELKYVFTQLAIFLKSPLGHAFLQASLRINDEISEHKREHLWQKRYSEIYNLFEKIIPLNSTFDPKHLHNVISMALGSFYFQIFIHKAEVTDQFIETILAKTLLLLEHQ